MNGPFKNLHTTNGRADCQLELLDAEGLNQHGLRVHDVANIDEGESGTVHAAAVSIDGGRAGGSITRAENIDADHAIAFEIEQPAGSEELRPPCGHLRRS